MPPTYEGRQVTGHATGEVAQLTGPMPGTPLAAGGVRAAQAVGVGAVQPGIVARIDDDGRPVVEPGAFRIAVGGRQPIPEDLMDGGTEVLIGTFQVSGEPLTLGA